MTAVTLLSCGPKKASDLPDAGSVSADASTIDIGGSADAGDASQSAPLFVYEEQPDYRIGIVDDPEDRDFRLWRRLIAGWGAVVVELGDDDVVAEGDFHLIVDNLQSGNAERGPDLSAVSTPVLAITAESWVVHGLATGAAETSVTDVVLADTPLTDGADAQWYGRPIPVTYTATLASGGSSVVSIPEGDVAFTVESGSQTVDGVAAGRRAGFGAQFSSGGGSPLVFDRVVNWLLDAQVETFTNDCHYVNDGGESDYRPAVAVRLERLGCRFVVTAPEDVPIDARAFIRELGSNFADRLPEDRHRDDARTLIAFDSADFSTGQRGTQWSLPEGLPASVAGLQAGHSGFTEVFSEEVAIRGKRNDGLAPDAIRLATTVDEEDVTSWLLDNRLYINEPARRESAAYHDLFEASLQWLVQQPD